MSIIVKEQIIKESLIDLKSMVTNKFTHTHISGTMVFDGITFNIEFRFGDRNNCGGFDNCLKINNGKKNCSFIQNDYTISGHGYFGDDKFNVKSVRKVDFGRILNIGDVLQLELAYPLHSKVGFSFDYDFKLNESKIVLMRISSINL
jgi:hypothetical protein